MAVDTAWIAFAESNDAPALPEQVLGESLWRFIANPTVRELYRTLFRRVRETDQRVILPFRCDSPSVQRFMTLAVGIGDGPRGTLVCHVSLLREAQQPREATALYAASDPPSREWPAVSRGSDLADKGRGNHMGELLRLCSWCKRLDVDGWCDFEEALGRNASLFTEPVRLITHGVCPSCERSVMAAMP